MEKVISSWLIAIDSEQFVPETIQQQQQQYEPNKNWNPANLHETSEAFMKNNGLDGIYVTSLIVKTEPKCFVCVVWVISLLFCKN